MNALWKSSAGSLPTNWKLETIVQLLNVFVGRCPVRDLSTVINISLFHNMHQIRADSPTRETAQLFSTSGTHLVSGPLQLWNSKNSHHNPPGTSAALLTFTLHKFVPPHRSRSSGHLGPLLLNSKPQIHGGEGISMFLQLGRGGSAPVPEPHVLKTNLFKTCLTSPHHPLATESDSIL